MNRRVARALAQRLYKLDEEEIGTRDDTPERLYHVLGSTGNVYTVRIGERVSCDCADARRGNVCKHRFFVLLRVLGLRRDSDEQAVLLRADTLTPYELRWLLLRADRAPDEGASADTSVVEAYRAAAGERAGATMRRAAEARERKRATSDECPICYDAFGDEHLVVCDVCRNGMHRDCFGRWAGAKASRDCPMCRATIRLEAEFDGAPYISLAGGA